MKSACFLLRAFFLGLCVGPAIAVEPTTGPSGFSAPSDSAKSEGKTGETADCPIKKEVNGKTFCFQNDPALAKPQGGH